MIEIGIVVLNYKNYKDTICCVESLIKQKEIRCDIVIVDNGSGNESVSVLRKQFADNPLITIIELGKNVGYAKGNNVGIKKLREKGYATIFIANSDLIFNSDYTMKQIVDEYEPGIGLIDPIIKNLNGEVDQRVVYKKKFLYLRIIKKMVYLLANKPFPNKQANADGSIEQSKKLVGLQNDRYVVSGSGFLLTEEFFNYYTGLFPKTFLYFEEWGTILLLHKAGLLTKIAACDYITHKGAASTPNDIKSVSDKRRKINIESGWRILGLLFTPAKIAKDKY